MQKSRNTTYERIVILVPRDRVRAWVVGLSEVLEPAVHLPVEFHRVQGHCAPAPSLPLENFERRLTGTPVPDHAAWVSSDTLPSTDRDPFSWRHTLTINALECASGELPENFRTSTMLAPIYEGGYRLHGLLPALLDSRPPALHIALMADGEMTVRHGAVVAVPGRELLPRALAKVFACVIMLMRGVAENLLDGKPLPLLPVSPPTSPQPEGAPYVSRFLRTYLPKIPHRLTMAFFHSEGWRIGYRPIKASANAVDIAPAAPISLLQPDRHRFYADPMLIEHDGRTALFFEDFDCRANKGKISFVILQDGGRCSEPAEALSRPYHLSYPFVFSHDGNVLMMPETTGNRTVEIYEAVAFPHTWRLRSVLLKDIVAADATLWFDECRSLWWMFTSVGEGNNASDTLSLFFSRCIDGPWEPHPANPVKFDAGSSRPAGPLICAGGRLLRPAQDCRYRYGGGLVWCEITELTQTGFQENVVGWLSPGKGYTGLHTYSRTAGFEVFDLRRPRWRSLDGFRHSSGRVSSLPSKQEQRALSHRQRAAADRFAGYRH